MSKRVVLYDSVCLLCQGTVQFILKKDPKGKIAFASLQSISGKKLLESHNYPSHDTGTVLLLEEGKVYTKSSAVLRICKQLSGMWPILFIFILIPAPLRDVMYDWVARNRYRWFGKSNTCFIPRPEWRHRFIEEEKDV